MSDLWKNLTLPADLREYMVLSPSDVNALTIEALKAANPTAKLEAMLIERATERLAEFIHPPVPTLVASTLGSASVSIGAVHRALTLVRADLPNEPPPDVPQGHGLYL